MLEAQYQLNSRVLDRQTLWKFQSFINFEGGGWRHLEFSKSLVVTLSAGRSKFDIRR
jgi:hypothetical protein